MYSVDVNAELKKMIIDAITGGNKNHMKINYSKC